jgi:Ca2+-transporting ATPase
MVIIDRYQPIVILVNMTMATEQNVYATETINEVASHFGVSISSGLSSEEADWLIETYGRNELREHKPSFWRLYIAPFIENWLIIVYLVSGIIILILSLVLRRSGFGAFTIVFVAINAVLAIIQQARARKTLKKLRELVKDRCKVIRDGEVAEIDARLVVPGDILSLKAGDKVPADARLVDADSLFADESALTGESVTVEKSARQIEFPVRNVIESTNCVFMGTFITSGSGTAIVTATGTGTDIGRVSAELGALVGQEIPLRRKLNNFAKYLTLVVCAMFGIIVAYKFATAGPGLTTAGSLGIVLDSITNAVQFMPINIILLVTIILYTGVLALGSKGVIVKNLSATDSLGRISIACTDKTGTLTTNQMTVKFICMQGKTLEVTGSGYDEQGSVLLDGTVLHADSWSWLTELVTGGMLNSDAGIVDETHRVAGGRNRTKVSKKVIGDPMEAAILVLGGKLGVELGELTKRYEKVRKFPFEPALKRMTTVWTVPSNDKWQMYCKGATELLLGLSATILGTDGPEPLTQEISEKVYSSILSWSEKGFRTLGFAMKETIQDGDPATLNRETTESDLLFLGFMVIEDPPRQDVEQAAKDCTSANVRVVMITGDHSETAKAIGKEVGIYHDGDHIATGGQIQEIPDEVFAKTSIFARISPHDKEIIVQRFQHLPLGDHGSARARVVAMTGDGVNDALALGIADVGIAMGISGTDIAREAADIIISDDSLTSVVRGIREGRGLFARIRTIIYFFVYANLVEASFLFATSFIPHFQFFSLISPAAQLYLIIGLSHTVPPVGLAFDKTSTDIMSEKPRNAEEIFNKNVLLLMAVQMGVLLAGFLISFSCIYPVFTANYGHVSPAQLEQLLNRPRTVALGIVISIEIFTLFSIRRPNVPVWKSFKHDIAPIFVLFAILSYGSFVLMVYVPLAGGYWFSLEALPGVDWLLIVGTGIGAVLVMELAKAVIKKKRGPF